MSQPMSSKEAAAYLIDPLNAPEPSQETGPGTHFYPPDAKVPTSVQVASPVSPSSSTNPFRKSSVSSAGNGHSRQTSRDYTAVGNGHSRQTSRDYTAVGNGHSRQTSRDYTAVGKGHSRQTSREITYGAGSNYASGSPSGSPKPFPKYRESAFSELNDGRPRSGSGGSPPIYSQGADNRPRRTSSLTARFAGDDSHKPLDMIRRDSRKANRSPHLTKKHLPGADTVDRLDVSPAMPYHHEGPYDAASLARNNSFESSPLAALADSNREALKATPAEKIKDALDRHMPIEGVASVPPGERDSLGRVYNYEEGTDMMRDPNAPGGPYKQWPGVDYAKDDLEGKGEPGYSLDRALRNHTIHERDFDGSRGIELSDRPLMSNYDGKQPARDGKSFDSRDPVEIAGGQERYSDLAHDIDVSQHASGHNDHHSNVNAHVSRTTSLRKAGEGLKKRLSISRKFREIHDGAVD